MKITLIMTGKSEPGWVQQGLELYLKRIGFYIPLEVKFIPEPRNTRNLTQSAYRQKEGQLLWPFLEGKNDVFLLDERGEEFTSREFAGFLEKKMIAGCRELIFVIGGPYGFPESTVNISSGKISLSKLTFSHQMVRLLFAEQLYRAFTIIKGEPYHHD